MKTTLALFLILMAGQCVAADSIVVLGKLVYNEPMDYVPDECPEDEFCMNTWWKSVVNVQKTIVGSNVSGKVAAAVMQHTWLDAGYKKRVRLFVLRPIDDPNERAKLRVDYYLEDMSMPHQMFCVLDKPSNLGITPRDIYVNEADDREHCFELPEKQE
jgi:hypothetical protein